MNKKVLLILLFINSIFLVKPSILDGQGVISADSLTVKTMCKLYPFTGRNTNYILMRDRSEISLVCYDTTFKLKHTSYFNLAELKNKSELVGVAEVGEKVMILFSSGWVTHFSLVIYDTLTHEFRYANNFDLDGLVYLNWFPSTEKFNVVTIQKKSSIISVLSFDKEGKLSQLNINMEKENFGLIDKMNLHDALLEEDQSFVKTLFLAKVVNGNYQSDIEGRYHAKMYYNDTVFFITINKALEHTQVLKLNILKQSYEHYVVPYPKNDCVQYEQFDMNSFLLNHTLFTAFIYKKGLIIGMYDLDRGVYIHEWGPEINSLNSLISSSLYFENIFNGKIDSLKSWGKFQNKLTYTSFLSLGANITDEGNLDLYVGGLLFQKKAFGAMSFGNQVSGSGSSPSLSFSIPAFMLPTFALPGPLFYQSISGAPVESHYFFKTTLKAETLEKISASRESIAFQKFKTDFGTEIRSKKFKNFTFFNRGRNFYYGAFIPEQNIYAFFRFQ